MHFAIGHGATTRGILVFTGTESASLSFVDLLPLVELTENLDFLRCLLRFSHDLRMKMAQSFLSPTQQLNPAGKWREH